MIAKPARSHRPKSTRRDALPPRYLPGYDKACNLPMSREEEVAAFTALRAGDESQRDRIACANMRFCIEVAGHYDGRGVLLADLVQEGASGMLVAIERFDHTRGLKFISYAVWWIRQACHAAIGDQATTVRLPLNKFAANGRVFRRVRQMEAEQGRPVDPTEAAKELGVEFVGAMQFWSLDQPVPGYDENNDRGLFANTTKSTIDRLSVEPEDHTAEDDLREWVRSLLDNEELRGWQDHLRLTERERTILVLYFGFNGLDPLTLEQIGVALGVTRERIRQCKDKALAKLKARIERQGDERWEQVMELVEG